MSATPDFSGQVYKDTGTGNIWRANSTTPGDWNKELQNIQVKWTPNNIKLGEMIGFFSLADLTGVTTLTFLNQDSLSGFDIEANASLTDLAFPNLQTIQSGGILIIAYNTALTTLSLPVFVSLGNSAVSIYNNTAITSISLPSFTTVSGNFLAYGNTSLTSISFPNYLPDDGRMVDFQNCALTQASVDHVLARCVANPAYVSGWVRVNAGTNSPPTSTAPGSDYAVLTARGVTVDVN